MHTIFWLAVLVAVCGIGLFVAAFIAVAFVSKFGSELDKFKVKHIGYVGYMPWRWLVLGIAGLIIAVTI